MPNNFTYDYLFAQLNEQKRQRMANILNGWAADGQLLSSLNAPSQKAPHWSSLDAMMRDLQSLPKNPLPKAADPPISPATRKKQINAELDIIRGVVPTPKGYVINPARAKDLMRELKSLGDA